jgi:hypothetical protein
VEQQIPQSVAFDANAVIDLNDDTLPTMTMTIASGAALIRAINQSQQMRVLGECCGPENLAKNKTKKRRRPLTPDPSEEDEDIAVKPPAT